MGYPPFSETPDSPRLHDQIVKGLYSFPDEFWSDISDSAKDLVRRMMCVDPNARLNIAQVLEHPISQRLIPTVDGKRVAAIEILLHSPMVETLIKRGEVAGLKEIMEKATGMGMQTFDQALFDLYEAGRITYEDALRNADSVNDLRLQIKLHSKESKDRDLNSGIGHLEVV